MRILCFLALCGLAGVCRVYLLCHYNPVIGDLNFNKGSCPAQPSPAESRARPRARRMKIDQWRRWDTSACTVCTLLQCTTAQSRRGQIYNQTLHYLKEGGMKNYWQFNTKNVFSTFYSMFKILCNFCKILYWSVLEWFFKAENSIYTKSTYNIWIKVTVQLEWKIQSTFL